MSWGYNLIVFLGHMEVYLFISDQWLSQFVRQSVMSHGFAT